MANILTSDDFVGEYEIPSGEWIDAKLDLYIAQTEEDILISLLGYTLYNEFITELAGTPASKWINLRDGDTYTTGSIVHYYKGIAEMLKYFTFFYYMRDNEYENTQVGFVVNNTTNSERNTPLSSTILRRMWNKGIDIYNDTYHYIVAKNSPTETYSNLHFSIRNKLSLV